MLLTLNANSLRSMLIPPSAGASPELPLIELPEFTRDVLGLHGLNLPTDLLAGATRDRLEKLRDRADKSGCACLLLIESAPQAFGSANAAVAAAATDRARRVVEAAHLLGCNSAALSVLDDGGDELAADRTVEAMRRVVDFAERLEVNVLIAPHDGFTHEPDRLTELIKKIGGFRIGAFPDFQAAAASEDPETYLRRLTPYASVVSASTVEFDAPAEAEDHDDEDVIDLDASLLDAVLGDAPPHKTYELEPLVRAVLAVGFDQTLAIDYRGEGDGTLGVTRSRAALEAALEAAAGA